VNEKLKAHNRQFYPLQSQRLVAEQIETLHWNMVTEDQDRAELDTVVVRKDADLTQTDTVESLPESYDDLHVHPDRETNAEEAEEYARLREELLELSRTRDTLRRKLAQYQHLQKLLEPLDQPLENVQPNLATRDGELSKELDRMRILLARVTGRISEMGKTQQAEANRSQPKAALTNEQKLPHLMELT